MSGADPLTLAGIVTPAETVPRGLGRVLYLDGVPIASQSGGEVHMSEDLDPAAWEARKALLRRGVGATGSWWPQVGPPRRRACSAPAPRVFPPKTAARWADRALFQLLGVARPGGPAYPAPRGAKPSEIT